MATDLRKLILEYRAIEEIDRILHRSGAIDETELIGFAARIIRRREILCELTARIRISEEDGETAVFSHAASFRTVHQKWDSAFFAL